MELLKQQESPGPFTKPTEVQSFMDTTTESKEKVERLRKEIHYAKLTCTTMIKTSTALKLTRNSKSLSSQEYADNLKSYLDTARSVKSLTINDLSNVLHGLSATSIPVNTSTSAASAPDYDPIHETSITDNSYKVGEHIAELWWESNMCMWHIGVVDKVNDDGTINVSYLVRSDSKGAAWVYPEESQVYKTVSDQVVKRNITVNYLCSVRIKCRLSDETLIATLNTHVETLMSKSEQS